MQSALATDPSLYPGGKVTGTFANSTQEAVENFQAEYGLPVTGVFDSATLAALNQIFYNQLCPTPSAPAQDLSLAVVTKLNALPQDYVPPSLMDITKSVKSTSIICVTQDTAAALKSMFSAAAVDGVALGVTSGYRRPEIQQLVHYFWIQTEGVERASHDSAIPYHSEHQLGTAVDLTGSSIGYAGVDDGFGDTPEGRWLAANAYLYGFNQSYPDKNDTSYVFEPWHYRFVGIALAKVLHADNLPYNAYAISQNATTTPPTSTATQTQTSVEQILVNNPHLF